jgi:hypothetical protein
LYIHFNRCVPCIRASPIVWKKWLVILVLLGKEEKPCSNSLLYDLLNYSNLETEGTARGYIRGQSHLLSGVTFPFAGWRVPLIVKWCDQQISADCCAKSVQVETPCITPDGHHWIESLLPLLAGKSWTRKVISSNKKNHRTGPWRTDQPGIQHTSPKQMLASSSRRWPAEDETRDGNGRPGETSSGAARRSVERSGHTRQGARPKLVGLLLKWAYFSNLPSSIYQTIRDTTKFHLSKVFVTC